MRNWLVCVSSVLLACSPRSPGLALSEAPDGSSTTTIADANQDADKLTLSMSLTVPSGAELHQCQLVALPTATDIEASGMSDEYTAGSHHFLLFETDLGSIPPDLTGQYDCTRGDEPVMK